MDAQAGMLARLFEHSMGLGPEWRVEDVWFESPASSDEELHVRVGRVPGAAVACPECGARCGVYDARERTWRHLDIWQFRTVVHCRVPRAHASLYFARAHTRRYAPGPLRRLTSPVRTRDGTQAHPAR